MMSAEVVAMVTTRYGLGSAVGLPAYAARGELGRIWRLATTRGVWAVKEALVPVAESDAAADVSFQLAAAAAGLPLPRPVLTTDGQVTVRGADAVWRVYEWVDLDPAAPDPSAADLGALLARLHRVPHRAAGPVGDWFAAPLGRERWSAVAAALPAMAARLAELVGVEALVRPPNPAQVRTCHRDVNAENIRHTTAGPLVVLDWENSGPAEPRRELAALLWEVGDDAPAALAAYGGPPPRPEDFSMAIAVQGHLFELYARRSLDPAESAETRDRSAARLTAMLERPLTTDAIDAMLGRLR
ncbi:phosphotransferase [Asanoa sp. WMMD1127]|uniref:phosphotransferase n=1 Tax=Asanoa sp. WMMD1127 TaxID=3016107 RepID=UPI002415F54A|nr:phosphotransferase [Asanoa sp. WMMD1127]MDG4826317.1 phosphotransferase [Asanoa sp. WMMD1127]